MNAVSIRRNTLREAPRWVHGFAWGVFAVITFALLVLFCRYRDTDIWFLWMGRPLKSRGAFAEAVYSGIFRTRSNTRTNLSYIFVGLYARSECASGSGG